MTPIRWIGWRRFLFTLVVAVVISAAVLQTPSDDPEIALVIGEPWEDMRKRSSASIASPRPGSYSFHIPKSDARLRFVDPQYGFTTPAARFFAIIYDNEIISSVRMSPQIEPLLLDDTLKIVLDLQEQWRQSGWTILWNDDFPPLADTPEWRVKLKDKNRGGTAYWRAGDKYQIMLVIHRFKDVKPPQKSAIS